MLLTLLSNLGMLGDAPIPPSGGYPAYDYERRRTRKEISESRKRVGLDDKFREEVAGAIIADVAARQALVLERDEQKRFEELLRNLALEGIEFDARHLTALNIQRQRLIDSEIAARLKLFVRQREEQELILIMLMAASIA